MMMPTPEVISENKYRIYYGSRNARNQSSIGAIIVDFSGSIPKEVSRADYPLLSPGKLGAFDDNGVLPSCSLTFEGEKFLYYVGFKPGGTTRMDLFGGLSRWNSDQAIFERVSEAPILERTKVNPYINTAPWIIDISGTLVMYYVAGLGWASPDLPSYEIQIATSSDGVNWDRQGYVAIPLEAGENAAARPSVFRRNGEFEMWFSSKGDSYSAKVAKSFDGFTWSREQIDPVIATSPRSHDNEMQEYFVPMETETNLHVAFNGNDYGRHGISVLRETS